MGDSVVVTRTVKHTHPEPPAARTAGARWPRIGASLAGLGCFLWLAAGHADVAEASHELPADGGASRSDRRVTWPSRRRGAVTALVVAPTRARRRPGGRRRLMRVETHTAWGQQPQVLLVLGARRRRGMLWLRVLLPRRPNGTRGWIPRNKVYLQRTRVWVDVRLGRREVRVYRRGRLVRRDRAVIGAPSTPTPRTLAAIYERARQPDPRAFLGTYALHLTALSNVHFQFGGGPGRIAIHGRGGASFADPLGSARSNGCIRVNDRAVNWLARHLPLGTPVRIRR